MILRRIALVDVRSYRALEWQPDAAMNVVVGPNGTGKTNLLEAIALVGGMRLRPLVHEGDLVRHGAAGMAITAELGVDAEARGGTHEITFRLSGRSRRYLRDGQPLRPGQDGTPALVAFTPDDLDLVKGGPDARRHLLERDLSQLSLAYRDLLRRYARAVVQRNALLRAVAAGERGEGEIAPWDEAVAKLGADVQRWRADAIGQLAPSVADAYDALAGRPSAFAVSYRPRRMLGEDRDPSTTGGAPGDEAASLLAALRAARRAELARGYTLLGPHRDDLDFVLGGAEMRAFASQGEQRTAVVAVKLALLRRLAERRGDRPLLVLDDVLSELDETRQDRLLGAAKGFQTFVTTTSAAPSADAKVWRTGGGGLTPWLAGA